MNSIYTNKGFSKTRKMGKLSLLVCSCLLVALTSTCWARDDEPEPEPAFPSLIDTANRPRIHITSESFDANYGYETIEEYIDLEIGKATYTSSTKQGHRTTFIDSTTQTIYRYKPYTCLMLKQSELISAGEVGVWSKVVKVYGGAPSDRDPSSSSKDRELHLYEVAAVWMNAADMPKVYSKSSVVYSSGKDMFLPAHRWTVDNGASGKVHLFFIESSINSKTANDNEPQQLSLEMIQEEFEGKIKRTINILSVDYYIPMDIYETLLQVPLGYGCKPDNKPADFEAKQQIINAPNRQKPNRLRMEATATKFETGATTQDDKKSTDTISIDLLVKSFDQSESSVQMVRQRNSQKDIKVVTDYLLRVQYSIDLRRGTCLLSHAASWQANQDKFSVEFNNGLQIGFDQIALSELFDSNPSCQVIKINDRGKPVEFVFEECLGQRVFGKLARIMKKYSLRRDEPESLNLESVTVWVLDDKMSAASLVESYHFYIVENDIITDRLELTRLFDVSEECYLNNDLMKYGRDYAWIELTYPMASRQLDTLASHSHELKERILQQCRLLFDSLMRMPRVELMFTDSAAIIRLLLLDEPSLIYMWDSYPQKALVQTTTGTLQETTVDEMHCADLCRLHGCMAMSYCTDNYVCLINTSRLKLTVLDEQLRRDSTCTAYGPPAGGKDIPFQENMKENLHYIISWLQQEDLASIELPKMPDELLYPQSVTGLSDHDMVKKQAEYINAVYLKLEELDKFLPTLTMMFALEGSMLFMVPSKFELEQDPLAEFSLNSQESIEDALPDNQLTSAPAFHEGLPLYRYKLSAFRDTEQPLDAHQYVGLSYDQCALACADGRCSSFSYCKHRQDCMITNVYNLEQAKRDGQIVQDSDCFIAQRDFLSKFNEFANVLRPSVYKKTSPAHNPTECAHSCVVESDFNCLAFDFCRGGQQTANDCYYLDSRIIYTGSSNGSTPTGRSATTTKIDKTLKQPTGCSHYSRSYLAEFTRIAYRQVNESQLIKLKTTIFGGQSVDKCADICLNELADCTAFEFCFNPDAKDGPKQQCTMIESRPDGQDAREFRIVQDSEGNIVEQGKFFTTSVDCHVFALRRDTSEAHMRDVALESLSPAEAKARGNQAGGGGGMTLGSALMLYLTTTAMFAVIGCGLVLVKHHSPYFSDRYDRFKALFGYY